MKKNYLLLIILVCFFASCSKNDSTLDNVSIEKISLNNSDIYTLIQRGYQKIDSLSINSFLFYKKNDTTYVFNMKKDTIVFEKDKSKLSFVNKTNTLSTSNYLKTSSADIPDNVYWLNSDNCIFTGQMFESSNYLVDDSDERGDMKLWINITPNNTTSIAYVGELIEMMAYNGHIWLTGNDVKITVGDSGEDPVNMYYNDAVYDDPTESWTLYYLHHNK